MIKALHKRIEALEGVQTSQQIDLSVFSDAELIELLAIQNRNKESGTLTDSDRIYLESLDSKIQNYEILT